MLHDKKKYIVWTDTGSHFRCAEFMHYLFVELANLGIEVSYNLFCEKHGKNSRDQHFSCVSQFVYNESMIKQLTSSRDICDAIERQQTLANLNTYRRNNLNKSFNSNYIQSETNKSVCCTAAFIFACQLSYVKSRWP